jgi:hypothetical protein
VACIRPVLLLPAAASALLLLLTGASSTQAESGDLIAIADLPDLKERARAFRQALRDITVDPHVPPRLIAASPTDLLVLESRYRFTEHARELSLDEHPGLPGRRDLVFEEQWLLAGREDDHERAARHWLGRRLKGSDLRSRSGPSPLKVKFAWDHGPLAGIGHGPYSVRAGASQWRLQWSKRWARSNGPWRSRVWIGEDDGDFQAQFMIGRTLLDSYGR